MFFYASNVKGMSLVTPFKVNFTLRHVRTQGGGGIKSRRSPPPPPAWIFKIFCLLCGGGGGGFLPLVFHIGPFFYDFLLMGPFFPCEEPSSPCGVLFATFFSMWEAFLSLWSFCGLTPPPPRKFCGRPCRHSVRLPQVSVIQ